MSHINIRCFTGEQKHSRSGANFGVWVTFPEFIETELDYQKLEVSVDNLVDFICSVREHEPTWKRNDDDQ